MSNSHNLITLPPDEALRLCAPTKLRLLQPQAAGGKALLTTPQMPMAPASPSAAAAGKAKIGALAPNSAPALPTLAGKAAAPVQHAPGLFTGAGPKAGALAKSATGMGGKLAKGSSGLAQGAAGLSKAVAIPGIASAGGLPMGSLSKLLLGTGGASIGLGSSAFVLTPLLTLAGVGLGAFVIYRRSRAMTLKAESSKLKQKAKILDQQSEKLWPIGF
ncbi:MAG: hypothetical protein H7842_06470 [Gammaproteobacteria bacterium SHHR-1]|uniref:hypothetical protein n=1 Tax=Magnetovirga frankeli TaxID=947516 RepID=UPI001293B972|nr:hypothetical protein D5125_16215 [gamma proteobacterium SS-5]